MSPTHNENPYVAPNPQAAKENAPVLAELADQPGVVSVAFSFAAEDWLDFVVHHHMAGQKKKVTRVSIVLFIGMLCLLYFLVTGLLATPIQWSLIAAPSFGMLFIATRFFYFAFGGYRRKVRANVEKMLAQGTNRALFGLTTVSLSPEHIHVTLPLSESTHQWLAVERIETAPQGCYLYNSAVTAIIVPLHAFDSEAQFERFVDLARQYQTAAEIENRTV